MRKVPDSRIDVADKRFWSVIGKMEFGWNVNIAIFISVFSMINIQLPLCKISLLLVCLKKVHICLQLQDLKFLPHLWVLKGCTNHPVLWTVSMFVHSVIRECWEVGEVDGLFVLEDGDRQLRRGWANRGRTLWIRSSVKGSMMDMIWPIQGKGSRIRAMNSESCRYRR